VFAQFYGNWYIDCAKNLWESTASLTTQDGRPLREHLKAQGIKRLGALDPNERPGISTFEKHVKDVENAFWNERFPVYSTWKKNWYDDYRRNGYFHTKTGFTCGGFMKRNEAINYPVQGSAFHCLLWSLKELVLKELPKRNMRAKIIGQIHDSIVADVPGSELNEFLHLAQDVMCRRLLEHWDWIVVPLKIEADVAPLNCSWGEKEEYAIV
jgi:hypothetical protein